MSLANRELVRRLTEAFNSGSIERILELTHPEFEGTVPPELSAEPDTYRGHEGIRRYFVSFQEVMAEIRFHQEGCWEAGGANVVVDMRMSARGRSTGIAVEQRFAQVWRIRDGRVAEIRTLGSLAAALREAGLSTLP